MGSIYVEASRDYKEVVSEGEPVTSATIAEYMNQDDDLDDANEDDGFLICRVRGL
jgi:hypothetical protein